MHGWIPVYDKWSQRFLSVAQLVAGWSKDPSTQVGAVLTDGQRRVISTGFNGFPERVGDDERLFDRANKYKMVVHAEANAIINATRSTMDARAFVTHVPCSSCMALLINAGISHITCPEPSADYLSRWEESAKLSTAMATEAGIQLRLLTKPSQETN